MLETVEAIHGVLVVIAPVASSRVRRFGGVVWLKEEGSFVGEVEQRAALTGALSTEQAAEGLQRFGGG
jgi:hypothetical protein